MDVEVRARQERSDLPQGLHSDLRFICRGDIEFVDDVEDDPPVRRPGVNGEELGSPCLPPPPSCYRRLSASTFFLTRWPVFRSFRRSSKNPGDQLVIDPQLGTHRIGARYFAVTIPLTASSTVVRVGPRNAIRNFLVEFTFAVFDTVTFNRR